MRVFLLWTILTGFAYGYELVIVQGVSNSTQTFITRTGKKEGVIPGKKVTFTSENIAVIAKALKVSREFTQWEIESQIADVPFEKGQILTMNDAEEYLWTLTPEEQKKKFIKSHIRPLKHSISITGGLSSTLNETVSNVDETAISGGYIFEIFYEKEMSRGLAFAPGLRYEYQVRNYSESSYTTTRAMVLGDARFYFEPMLELYNARMFIGIGMGIGVSSTETSLGKQAGSVRIVPAMKGGMNLPISDDWEMIAQVAFESLYSEETLEDSSDQTTTQTNYQFGAGIKRYF